MSTPRTLTTLPTEIQEMIFATASSARPTVKDLTILASISVHYRHMMLRVLRRLRKALDTQYNKLIAQREAKYPRTPGRPETEGEQQLRSEARKRLTVAAHRIAMEDCQFIEFIVVVRWLEEWETDCERNRRFSELMTDGRKSSNKRR